MTDARTPRLAITALALAIVLSGCSAASGAGHDAPAAAEGAAAEGAHGEAAEVVAFPMGFPVDDLPMPDGELLHVAHPGDTWAAWVASDDLVADLAEATSLLVDAGYTLTNSADGFAEFTHPDRMVRIIASVDGSWGSSLAYTLTDGAIEPDDAEEQDAESSH